MRRRLLFGLALLLAMASIYVGLLDLGRGVQYTLAGAAIVAAFLASRAPYEARPPARSDDGAPPA